MADDNTAQDDSNDVSSGIDPKYAFDKLVAALAASQPIKQPTPKQSPFQNAQNPPALPTQPKQYLPQPPRPAQPSPYQNGAPTQDPNAGGGQSYNMKPSTQPQMAQNNASRPAFYAQAANAPPNTNTSGNAPAQQQTQQNGENQDPRMVVAQKWAMAYHQANPRATQKEIMDMTKTGLESGMFGPAPMTEMDKAKNAIDRANLQLATLKESREEAKDDPRYVAAVENAKETAKKSSDMAEALKASGPKASNALELFQSNTDNALETIGLILGKPASSDGKTQAIAGAANGWTTGFMGGLGSHVWGTPAYDLDKAITSLKSEIGLDKLAELKDSAKGTGLGRVTNTEFNALSSAWASLDQAQSPQQFQFMVQKIQKQIVQSKQRIKQAYQQTYGTAEDDPLTKSQDKEESPTKTVNYSDWK